jgi:hypothetical protein
MNNNNFELIKIDRLVYFNKCKSECFDYNNINYHYNKVKNLIKKFTLLNDTNLNKLSLLLEKKYENLINVFNFDKNKLVNKHNNIIELIKNENELNNFLNNNTNVKKLLNTLNMDLMFGDLIYVNKNYLKDNNINIIIHKL